MDGFSFATPAKATTLELLAAAIVVRGEDFGHPPRASNLQTSQKPAARADCVTPIQVVY